MCGRRFERRIRGRTGSHSRSLRLTTALHRSNSSGEEFRHRTPDLSIPHEPVPDFAWAQVRRAEKSDSHVNADGIFVGPTIRRMEGIDEAVALVDPLPEHTAHFHQSWDADLGSEHE